MATSLVFSSLTMTKDQEQFENNPELTTEIVMGDSDGDGAYVGLIHGALDNEGAAGFTDTLDAYRIPASSFSSGAYLAVEMFTNASGSLLTDSKLTLWQDGAEIGSATGENPTIEDIVLSSGNDVTVVIENNDASATDGPGYYYQGWIAVGYTPS